jgi:hypothetical protein
LLQSFTQPDHAYQERRCGLPSHIPGFATAATFHQLKFRFRPSAGLAINAQPLEKVKLG